MYEQALEFNPKLFNARLGKFYAHQEMRQWDESEEILKQLDEEEPAYYGPASLSTPNWRKLDVTLAKGWYYVYQDRLSKAQDYFWALHQNGPANIGVRSGLAHVYYWRGWPRLALREFSIIKTRDPEFIGGRIGHIKSQNDLADKVTARKAAQDLISEHPKNKHVQQLIRQLELEEKRELVTDVVWYTDENDTEDLRFQVTLLQPITLWTHLKAYYLWNGTDYNEGRTYLKRAGLGIEHIFNSSWQAAQTFSVNYDDGDDFGSFTELYLTPDDYWRLGASYDSYAIDIPYSARAAGIESNKYEGSVTYQESDQREYAVNYNRYEFSDDNIRQQWLAGYEQGLLIRGNWKFRLFLDFYTSRNTREDTPYFNPRHDYSLSATVMVDRAFYRMYNRSFVNRLFLTGGGYKQDDQDIAPIWGIRYEQEHDLADTHNLLIGVNWQNRNYDGESEDSLAFYLTYRLYF